MPPGRPEAVPYKENRGRRIMPGSVGNRRWREDHILPYGAGGGSDRVRSRAARKGVGRARRAEISSRFSKKNLFMGEMVWYNFSLDLKKQEKFL